MFKVYVDRFFFLNISIKRNFKNLDALCKFLFNKANVEIYEYELNNKFTRHGELVTILMDSIDLQLEEINYTKIKSFDKFQDPYPFKLFFLNIESTFANSLMAQFGFAVLCPNNFEELWGKLTFAGRLEISNLNQIRQLNKFKDLNKYIYTQLSFGILQDPYLIAKDNNKASFKFFIKSIFSLQNLKLLLLKEPNKDDTLEQLQNQFNNILGSIGEIKNQPILLVKKELGDNDRHCFTNYYYINLNHSLNAFNEQGNLVNNQQLNIESYFVNLITFSRDLEKMKEKVNYVNTHQDQIINMEEAANILNTIRSFFMAE